MSIQFQSSEFSNDGGFYLELEGMANGIRIFISPPRWRATRGYIRGTLGCNLHFAENSPEAKPEIMAELWLKRQQSASKSVANRAAKNTANWLPNLKFIGYYGKSWNG